MVEESDEENSVEIGIVPQTTTQMSTLVMFL